MIKTTVYLKTGEKIEFVDAEAKPVFKYVDGKFDSLTIIDKEGNHLGIFLDIAAVVSMPIIEGAKVYQDNIMNLQKEVKQYKRMKF